MVFIAAHTNQALPKKKSPKILSSQIWANNFYDPPAHAGDRSIAGKRRWFKKEYRKIKVAEALRRMPQLVEEYRKERREAKRLSWFEDMVVGLLGQRVTVDHIRKRKIPASAGRR